MKAALPPTLSRCSKLSVKSSISTVLAEPPKTTPRYGVNSQSADAGDAADDKNITVRNNRAPCANDHFILRLLLFRAMLLNLFRAMLLNLFGAMLLNECGE